MNPQKTKTRLQLLRSLSEANLQILCTKHGVNYNNTVYEKVESAILALAMFKKIKERKETKKFDKLDRTARQFLTEFSKLNEYQLQLIEDEYKRQVPPGAPIFERVSAFSNSKKYALGLMAAIKEAARNHKPNKKTRLQDYKITPLLHLKEAWLAGGGGRVGKRPKTIKSRSYFGFSQDVFRLVNQTVSADNFRKADKQVLITTQVASGLSKVVRVKKK